MKNKDLNLKQKYSNLEKNEFEQEVENHEYLDASFKLEISLQKVRIELFGY